MYKEKKQKQTKLNYINNNTDSYENHLRTNMKTKNNVQLVSNNIQQRNLTIDLTIKVERKSPNPWRSQRS